MAFETSGCLETKTQRPVAVGPRATPRPASPPPHLSICMQSSRKNNCSGDLVRLREAKEANGPGMVPAPPGDGLQGEEAEPTIAWPWPDGRVPPLSLLWLGTPR